MLKYIRGSLTFLILMCSKEKERGACVWVALKNNCSGTGVCIDKCSFFILSLII